MDTVSVKGIEVADDIKGSRQDPYQDAQKPRPCNADGIILALPERDGNR